MHSRTIKVPNGEIFSYIRFYNCDNCNKEVCEMDTHMVHGENHYCWECSFIVGVIDEATYLKWSPIGGIPHVRAAVRDNEVVHWNTKKPPWEMPDKEFRRTKAYRDWRQSVLSRDNYTCQHCGTNEKLEGHHIKPFSKYEKQRYKVSNGLTLCQKCHRKVHSKKEQRVSG